MAEETVKKNNTDSMFGTEPIGKLIAKFSIPCVISLLVNSLYNIVDQIFIGQGVGYLGNAATNIAFPLVIISAAFALMIGDGGAAFLSIRLGQRKKGEATHGVGNAIVMCITVGILFLVLCSVFKVQLLKLFGATETTLQYAIDYSTIIIYGLPFFMTGITLNSVIRADGNPKIAMTSMLTGAAINTVLDPIFIFKLNMGVKGAAYATILGQIATFLISAYCVRHFKSITLRKKHLKVNPKIAYSVAKLGISSFINQIAITVVIIALNNSLKVYGAMSQYGSDIPLSASGIVLKVNQIMISVVVGIAVGAQPIFGYNYGAKNYARVKKALLVALGAITVCTTLGFISFTFFPQYIILLFGQEDALYNEFAMKCFKIFLMLCILTGFQIMASIFFQALGKPMKAATLSLSRQILFFLPALLILPRFLGLEGCLFAGPVADGLSFLLASIFMRNEIKHLDEEEAKMQRKDI